MIKAAGLASANEIVSAFDLNVAYDPRILQAMNVTFGTLLGDEANNEAITDFLLSPGNVEVAQVSLMDDDSLARSQGGGFNLVTLSYQALAAGTTDLVFVSDPVFGIDIKGRNAEILGVDVSKARVTVGAIPLPPTLVLFLVGLGAFAMAAGGVGRLL